MMNLSPEQRTGDGVSTGAGGRAGTGPHFGEHVLRGERAGLATVARFDIDLRRDAVTAAETVRTAKGLVGSQAHAAGYAAGWAEGRRAATIAALEETEQARQREQIAAGQRSAIMEQAVAALAAAATRLDRRATPDLEELEQTVVAVAFALAEAIVDRELAVATDPGTDAIARALSAAPANGPVTVRLHPDDVATLGEAAGMTGEVTVGGRRVVVVGDPSLRPGDATAECDTTTVDARLSSAIDRVREVFLGVSR